MTHMVEVKNLKKRYDNKQAVDGISFTVKKGEIFGILGPNGAGKTTTLEMMETLSSIDEGTVIIDGIDVAKNPQAIKYLIGVQPQSPAFQDKTRLTEVIEMFAAAYGEKVDPLQFLRDVELEDKAKNYVEELSGGQKQRLAVARAIANEPNIIFADEPTGNLDSLTGEKVEDMLFGYNKDKGVTLIIVTHDPELAAKCDMLVSIKDGKIESIKQKTATPSRRMVVQ